MKSLLLEAYDTILSSPIEIEVSPKTIKNTLGCTLQEAIDVFKTIVEQKNIIISAYMGENGYEKTALEEWNPDKDPEVPAFIFKGRLEEEKQQILKDRTSQDNMIRNIKTIWKKEGEIWYAILDISDSEKILSDVNNKEIKSGRNEYYNLLLDDIRNVISKLQQTTGKLNSYIVGEIGDAFKIIFLKKKIIEKFVKDFIDVTFGHRSLATIKFKCSIFRLATSNNTDIEKVFSRTYNASPDINLSELTTIFRVESNIEINKEHHPDYRVVSLIEESILSSKHSEHDIILIPSSQKHKTITLSPKKMYPIVATTIENKIIEGKEARDYIVLPKQHCDILCKA